MNERGRSKEKSRSIVRELGPNAQKDNDTKDTDAKVGPNAIAALSGVFLLFLRAQKVVVVVVDVDRAVPDGRS